MVPKTPCALVVSLTLFSGEASASDVVDLAASLIGRPYVWGAEGPDAFDCSGLTQYVFQQFGVDLPRRAISQSEFGEQTRSLQRGDLVFFSSDTRQSIVTHVGIYEGGGMMIDASKRHGRVRRDNLNDPYWTAHFVFARRVSAEVARRDDERHERPEGDVEPSRENGRREVVRALGRLAEGLFRRAARR